MRKSALILVGVVLLCCCASRETVTYRVVSEPPGSIVEVDGVSMGRTPTKIELATSKRWVGIMYSPDGWAYGAEAYSVTVLPPSGSGLISQTKVIRPSTTPQGGELFFDLGLEPVWPTQPIKVK